MYIYLYMYMYVCIYIYMYAYLYPTNISMGLKPKADSIQLNPVQFYTIP